MMAWEEASLLGAWFTHFMLTPKFCFSAGLLVLVGLHIDRLMEEVLSRHLSWRV